MQFLVAVWALIRLIFIVAIGAGVFYAVYYYSPLVIHTSELQPTLLCAVGVCAALSFVGVMWAVWAVYTDRRMLARAVGQLASQHKEQAFAQRFNVLLEAFVSTRRQNTYEMNVRVNDKSFRRQIVDRIKLAYVALLNESFGVLRKEPGADPSKALEGMVSRAAGETDQFEDYLSQISQLLYLVHHEKSLSGQDKQYYYRIVSSLLTKADKFYLYFYRHSNRLEHDWLGEVMKNSGYLCPLGEYENDPGTLIAKLTSPKS
ncbi:MAG: hypothetical protein IJ228_08120 [Succinivibrio sp.]|nr:hypothetical protein [Succinivibrio sp.]